MRRNSQNGKRRGKRRARPGSGGGVYALRAEAPLETPTASHWLAWRRRRPTRIRTGT